MSVEFPTDVLLELSRKYAPRRPAAAATKSIPDPSSSDEDDGNEVVVPVDHDGQPLPPFSLGTHALLSLVASRKQHAQSSTESSKAKRPRGLHTQVTVAWEDLPEEMQSTFAPMLKKNVAKGTYTMVSKQPGIGDGFQVQASNRNKVVRLGTVRDARVGALMVSAADRDPSLKEAPLACRDWLVRVLADPVERASWLARWTSDVPA